MDQFCPDHKTLCRAAEQHDHFIDDYRDDQSSIWSHMNRKLDREEALRWAAAMITTVVVVVGGVTAFMYKNADAIAKNTTTASVNATLISNHMAAQTSALERLSKAVEALKK